MSIDDATEAFLQRDKFAVALEEVFADEGYEEIEADDLKKIAEKLIVNGWVDLD